MKKSISALGAMLIMLTNVNALDNIKINGFATAAGGYISDNEVGATSINPTPGFDGYTDDKVSFQPDSLGAIQISSRITDDVSVTVQMVGRFSNTDSNVNLEWAYINYNLADDATLQLGRFRPSVYLLSSTVDVGYTYLWITPPDEVYSQAPMTYTDGINLLLNHTFSNDITIESQIYFSNVSQDLDFVDQEFATDFKDLMGADISLSNDYLKFRVGYSQTEFTTDLSGLDPIITSSTGGIVTTPTNDIPGLKIDNALGKFTSVGLTMDAADIIFIGEYAQRSIEDTLFTEDTTSYYGTLGYRIGDFTPHVTYSAIETENKVANTGSPLDPLVTGIRRALSTDAQTVTVGLRYEVNSKTALKFDYLHTNKEPQELDTTTGTRLEETDTNIYKIALSVIF